MMYYVVYINKAHEIKISSAHDTIDYARQAAEQLDECLKKRNMNAFFVDSIVLKKLTANK